MNFPQKINLNFVDYMKIEQNFDRAEDGTRQLLNESITTEFKLVDNSDGIYAKRDVYYRNYQYEPDDKALQAFRKPEKVIEETSASGYSEAYWDANRQGGSQQERNFGGQDDGPVAQLSRLFLDGESVEGAVHGYIPAPKEKEPLFYIGMMNTTISGNTLEGVRLRAGGMTTAWLNPHLFGRGIWHTVFATIV